MDKVKILRIPNQDGFKDLQIGANANNIDTNDGNNVQTALDNLNSRLNNDINNRFIQNEESIQNLGRDKIAIFDSIDRLGAEIEDINALFPPEAITAIIENASAVQVQRIQYTGNQQLNNITDSGLGQVSAFEAAAAEFADQQIGLIEDAKQTQINNFNTDAAAATQNQITSIDHAGDAKLASIKQAIQSKVEEVLESIPADYTDLSDDVEILKNTTVIDNAKQLISNNYIEDKVPYLFRPTSGNGADRAYDTIIGGSIIWNQLFPIQNVNYIYDTYTVSSNNDGKFVLTVLTDGTSTNLANVTSLELSYFKKGHKYLIFSDNVNVNFRLKEYAVSSPTIYENPSSLYTNIAIVFSNLASGTYEFHPQMFDLTQMFGSTIADHLYALETASAGSGIAKLKSWGFLADDYYMYLEPTLKSVEGLSAHIMKDVDENVVASYALDSTLTLRGIPKLDVDNNLYYDGDIYENDGTVTRKIRDVEITSCSSVDTSSTGKQYATVNLGAGNASVTEGIANNFLSNRYQFRVDAPSDDERWFRISDGTNLFIFDYRFTDLTTANTILAIEKPRFVYELATSATEIAEPYANLQIVDPNGTEEYVTTSIVPVGHITKYLDNLRKRIDDLPNVLDAILIHNTAFGPIASFADGAKNLPVDTLKVSIKPVQAGSGDPSPDNVRPITGWTGVNMMRTGKNLLNDSKRHVAAKTIVYLGDNSSNYIIPLKAGIYTFSANFSGQLYGVYYREENDTGNRSLWSPGVSTTYASFTIEQDGVYRFWVYRNATSGGVDPTKINYAQIELGSTPTAYEPYAASTYSITFPSEAGTVYGGALDVTNGVLTVDYKYYENAGTGNWSNIESDVSMYSIDDIATDALSFDTTGICNIGNLINDFQANGVMVAPNGRINLCGTLYSAFASVDALKAYLAENPLKLVYKLATPVTYQLTPIEVKTLLGINNIWADTGDSDVEYCANTQLYIEQLTKPTEDDMIANSAIASGKYFFVNNRLFLSIAPIADGAMIIPGNNCIETNIAEALNALNS